jgi:hypothetical protein
LLRWVGFLGVCASLRVVVSCRSVVHLQVARFFVVVVRELDGFGFCLLVVMHRA